MSRENSNKQVKKNSQKDKQLLQIVKKKQAVRLKVKACRMKLTAKELEFKSKHIQQKLLALPVLQSAKNIMCYVSKGSEVKTHSLIKLLLKQGKTVAVPFVVGRGLMQPAVITNFSDLTLADFQTLRPKKLKLLSQPIDLNIMPALAVSKTGDRVGWGGGFYDRLIMKYQPSFNLCLAFDCQIYDALPVTPLDQKVDGVVTESRHMLFRENLLN